MCVGVLFVRDWLYPLSGLQNGPGCSILFSRLHRISPWLEHAAGNRPYVFVITPLDGMHLICHPTADATQVLPSDNALPPRGNVCGIGNRMAG